MEKQEVLTYGKALEIARAVADKMIENPPVGFQWEERRGRLFLVGEERTFPQVMVESTIAAALAGMLRYDGSSMKRSMVWLLAEPYIDIEMER